MQNACNRSDPAAVRGIRIPGAPDATETRQGDQEYDVKPQNPYPEGLPLSALDLQILLVLSRNDLYGYAIMKEVENRSDGLLCPEIGSLYRVLGRLMDMGWVEEAPAPAHEPESHRGKPRRYYRITEQGANLAMAELARLKKLLGDADDLVPEASG